MAKLRKALEAKDEALFMEASEECDSLGIELSQMMEMVTSGGSGGQDKSSKNALSVITADDNVEEWQKNVKFPPSVFKGVIDLSWTVHPGTVPTGDPWDDNPSRNPRVHTEVA